MPRRSPPSPLRLHTGPLPPRGKPRHTLPSLPRPAFHGPTPSFTGPVPRARMAHTELPALAIPDPTALPGLPGLFSAMVGSDTGSGPSSPTSATSAASLRPESARKKSREFVRGPWDHSGAIHVPFDVDAVLQPPRPTAANANLR